MIAPAPKHGRKPAVYVAADELARLTRLVSSAATDAPGLSLLEAELDRAIVVRPEDFPRRFARLSSLVRYEDLMTGQVRQVRLVTPEDADIDRGRVSVLAPVGAALVGLTPGAEISWTDDGGKRHALRILDVVDDETA
jgi:regulator of nucleoside diphosphate kinase